MFWKQYKHTKKNRWKNLRVRVRDHSFYGREGGWNLYSTNYNFNSVFPQDFP